MIALAWSVVAAAAPRAREHEAWLEAYARGDVATCWDAASDRYRTRNCQGAPETCPHLDVPLGEPEDRHFSCGRKGCTFVRTDIYDTPPVRGSSAVRVRWIVSSDLDGRYEGVAMEPLEPRAPGSTVRAVARPLGVGCGLVTTFVAAAGALFTLLRTGRRPG